MGSITREITVQAPVDRVYAAWRNFENLPRFMRHLRDVRTIDGRRTHWSADGVAGIGAEWDAELVADEPERRIAWRSVEGSALRTSGEVAFTARGPATDLRVAMEYDAPAGPLGEFVASLLSDPDGRVGADLERFRELIEGAQEMPAVGRDGAGETLGGSMGPATLADLDAIAATNTGIAPDATDDPAVRKARGQSFGESDKALPNVD
jgi:uncharacterized membrane protein